MEAAMLDRLHVVDWQSLNAGQIAEWIEALISPNKDQRQRAGRELLEELGEYAGALGNVEEYGKILSNDAPVITTPIFVELLTRPEAPDKRTILKILNVLANYRNQDNLEPIHLSRAKQIYQILLTHFDLYIAHLNADAAHTRINAMYLCSRFDEKLPFVLETLLDRLEKDYEPDELGKLCASEIIFKTIQLDTTLASHFDERLIRLLRSWITSIFSTLSIKAQAALYLIQLRAEAVEIPIIKLLANVLKLPHDLFLDVPLFLDCVDAFMQLGIYRCTAILLDIFDDQTEVLQIFDTAVILMAINFGANDYHNFYVSKHELIENMKITIQTKTPINPIQFPLNELQIQVLSHFLIKDEIWNVETNLLAVFHLPTNKSELEALISEV